MGWLAIGLALTTLGGTLVYDGWWDSEDIPVLMRGIQSGRGYEGTDEYQPLGCDRYELPGSDAEGDVLGKPAPRIQEVVKPAGVLNPASGAALHLQRWTANEKRFATENAAPVSLALRLLNYPGWRVRVDGTTIPAGSAPETARMLVPLSAGAHQVDVLFVSTWDRLGGAIISINFRIPTRGVHVLRASATH